MSEQVSSGRRLDIALPPPLSLQELDEVANTYRRLLRDRKVTATRLSGLRGQRDRVAEQERRAFAKAIKDETKEPVSRLDKIDKDIELAERRLAAIEEAIDDSVSDVIACVDEHRDLWNEELLSQVEDVQRAYAEAIEEVARASDAFLAHISLLAFVRGFPEDEPTYRVRGSHVAQLRSPNGDPYWLAEVIDALRQDASVDFTPSASRATTDPLAARIQAEFEEKRRNQTAGLGFLTDMQIAEGLTEDLIAQGA